MGTIYAISFVGTDKVYVGSTVRKPQLRIRAHIYRLRRGDHHSIGLQRAAEKHGLSNLCFSILETVEDDAKVLEAEQKWIDAHYGRHLNASLNAASRLGMKMPEHAKMAISKSLIGNSYRRGIPHSDEVKAKIGAGVKRAFADGRRESRFDRGTLEANNATIRQEGINRAKVWLAMWREGATRHDIAAATGFDESTIRRALKRYFNITSRSPRK